MNEKTLQALFENFLIKEKIQYERGFKAHAYTIDFKVNIDGKICGVEAKSSKGNTFYALGQLVLAKRTFSHIYLLAPQEFLEKIQNVVDGLGVGTIIFNDGVFSF